MLKPLLFAALAAFGNAMFVYGQRGASPGSNPFLFTFGAVVVCGIMFVIAAAIFRTSGDAAYLLANGRNIMISGAGFFLTFVGFFLLYTGYGASTYVLYAVLSILTTTLGVGMLIYREPINAYQIAAIVLAIVAICLFSYGQAKLSS